MKKAAIFIAGVKNEHKTYNKISRAKEEISQPL